MITQSNGEAGGEWELSVGVGGKITKPGPLRVLMQVHEELVRIRPGRNASLAVWLAYYQRSVTLYEQIAEIDPFHGLEALYWAKREQHHAEEIAAQIRAQRSRT